METRANKNTRIYVKKTIKSKLHLNSVQKVQKDKRSEGSKWYFLGWYSRRGGTDRSWIKNRKLPVARLILFLNLSWIRFMLFNLLSSLSFNEIHVNFHLIKLIECQFMFLNSIINRFSNQKEGYIDFIKLRKTIEMMYLHLVHFKPIHSKEEGTAAPTTGGRRQDSTTQREGRENNTTNKAGGRKQHHPKGGRERKHHHPRGGRRGESSTTL